MGPAALKAMIHKLSVRMNVDVQCMKNKMAWKGRTVACILLEELIFEDKHCISKLKSGVGGGVYCVDVKHTRQ